MNQPAYKLSNKTLEVQIRPETAQVISVNLDGKKHQYIWPGGKSDYLGAGWQNSDLIMFPVVGPVPENQLFYNETSCTMIQHGISRCLPWCIDSESDNKILRLIQNYLGETRIPVRFSNETVEISWPFSFKLISSFELNDNELFEQLELINESNMPMPYGLGRHPAFNLPERPHRSKIEIESKTIKQIISLGDLRSLTNCVAFLEDSQFIRLTGEENGELFLVELEFPDFGNSMLWSPEEAQYIAIEPTTILPKDELLYKKLDQRKGAKILDPNSSEFYRTIIRFA